jgi:imidazolonepropionase-like amidohydrolase
MLSEESTFGSIVPGHDADLVVLSGPPFEFSTKILAVMIDGVWVYEREEEK